MTKRMVEYDHNKHMCGSPSIMDVFGNAWSMAYGHGENAGVWFEFNGMTVVIQRTSHRALEALNKRIEQDKTKPKTKRRIA